MEFLSEYGLFLAKSVTIVLAILIVLSVMLSARLKEKEGRGKLEVRNINERMDEITEEIIEIGGSEQQQKDYKKSQKKKAKEEKDKQKPRLFVISFNGDIQAAAASNLREEITAILQIATKEDEVLVKLESPGGVVHGYGLAASQLHRLRKKEIPLTVAVDKVAASGGYMMACVANKIIAAPFAILGSIGVIGQVPNFNKLLKRADVDYEMHTAGEYKRSLTMLGENTDEGRAKFKQDLEEIHQLFKLHVSDFRPELNVDEVANGDTWFGRQCVDNHLVDEIMTSDEYVLDKLNEWSIFEIKYEQRKSLQERLGKGVEMGVMGTINSALSKVREYRFF